MTRRALAAVATVVVLLVGGCTGNGDGHPQTGLSGRLDDGGVSVVAVLASGPGGTEQVRVTFRPQQSGYHLYSVDLPPGGVNGLGIATSVTVSGSLRAAGDRVVDQPVHQLLIDELDVELPVYPDGPVTVSQPVRRAGNGPAEVVVTYAACSRTTCLPPVRDRAIALVPVATVTPRG